MLLRATLPTLPMLRKLVGEEIELAWRPGASLWPVKMDQSQIDQVLANLCVNARDAIDSIGMITIETSNVTINQRASVAGAATIPGAYVMLAVTDTGCGMDQATLAHIFEPFFTTKEVGKGTGLGLPMVQGIVQQNRGQIEMVSQPGRGTTIRLYLPRHIEAVAAANPTRSRLLPSGHGETVLLVEDEPVVLQMATDVLEFLGYSVIAANTPGEALRRMASHAGTIDLLMTDIVMPEMNGAELAERVAAIQPGIKCLFLSGYAAETIAHHGMLEGDARFLQKPYTLQSLASKLREVLGDAPID